MRTYNPLNVGEIGNSVARALMAYPSCSLPSDESIEGGGVYTLHYRGAASSESHSGRLMIWVASNQAPCDPLWLRDDPHQRENLGKSLVVSPAFITASLPFFSSFMRITLRNFSSC